MVTGFFSGRPFISPAGCRPEWQGNERRQQNQQMTQQNCGLFFHMLHLAGVTSGHGRLLRINRRIMKPSVACQKALAAQDALFLVFKPSRPGRRHNAQIEVDQVAVVQGIALKGADPVRVMAGGTGRLLLHDMLPVFETGVAQQNGPAVAFVAQGLVGGRLGCIVAGNVSFG
jgi:hypothetical protein